MTSITVALRGQATTSAEDRLAMSHVDRLAMSHRDM